MQIRQQVSDLLQIMNLHQLLFCALFLLLAAPDLNNSPKIEIETYRLNNFHLLQSNLANSNLKGREKSSNHRDFDLSS